MWRHYLTYLIIECFICFFYYLCSKAKPINEKTFIDATKWMDNLLNLILLKQEIFSRKIQFGPVEISLRKCIY